MKKTKIKGTKALNKATTLIPPKGSRWKDEFDDGGYMDRQASSRQQAQQGVGSIPLWGQLAGATMSISDSVRGDQSSGSANAIANVISPSSGIRNAYESGHSEDMLVAAFNPIGGGVLAAQRTKEDQAKRQAGLDAITTRRLIDNSGSAFAKGGKISNYPKIQRGGYLKPISKDAVEVVGHDPSITDGVELENAFVDNNEVIDKEHRVFSDILKAPTGRSIAAEAKRLEKMKASSSRFKPSNDRVDGKIDELFNFQEQVKRFAPAQQGTQMSSADQPFAATIAAQEKTGFNRTGSKWAQMAEDKGRQVDNLFKEYMQNNDESDLRMAVREKNTAPLQFDKDNYSKGGKIHIKPENRGKFTAYKKRTGKTTSEALHSSDPHVRKMANFARNAKKWNHKGHKAFGGPLEETTPYKYNALDFSNQPGQIDLNPGGNMFNSTGDFNKPKSSAPSLDWQQVATTAAAFAPNIANAFQVGRLKGPANPQLETRVNIPRINADDQLVAANRQARLAQQVVQRNTAQGSNLVAGTGSILAKRLANQNDIYGNVNRQNAGIAAQETGMNMMVGARNSNRISEYNQAQNDFFNTKRRLESENIANASSKFQVMGRERNQMKRDQQEFQLIQGAYGDSAVLERYWRDNPQLAAAIEESLGKRSGAKKGNRMGGKLYKGKC